MQAHERFVVAAILGSLICACLPRFPDGDLGGGSMDGETDGGETESEGTQDDETQGACDAGGPICEDGALQVCNDGALEVSSCEDVCAQNGQMSNGCSGNECECESPPQAGVWEGETAAGYPLLFALSEDGRLLGFVTFVEVDSFDCSGDAGLTARQTVVVEDGAFEVAANLLGGDTPTTISGDFTGSDAAQGTIDGFSGSFVLVCGDSLQIGSGHVFDGTSWSATPCPDCDMECPLENDDYCDEPEGTGICFDGTDPADC
jgi:hypothetical protein